MSNVMDAYSFWAWTLFAAAVVLGGMFVVNLFLAVIFDEFMRAQGIAVAEQKQVQAQASAAAEQQSMSAAREGETAQASVGAPIVAVARDASGSLPESASLLDRRMVRSDGSVANNGDGNGADGGVDNGTSRRPAWRWRLRQLMLSEMMGRVSTAVVLFNVCLMCLPFAGQPAAWATLLEWLETVVVYAFAAEMALKLVSLGCAGYWGDRWNVLDGAIVSLSLAEQAATAALAGTAVNISFLRTLRLLRLLRLLKAWPGLYKIVMAFVKAVPNIANLFVLMFLLLTIFALLGMQAFGGNGMSESSRWHFDYYTDAMLTVFNIFVGGWVDAYEATSEAGGHRSNPGSRQRWG